MFYDSLCGVFLEGIEGFFKPLLLTAWKFAEIKACFCQMDSGSYHMDALGVS